LDASWIIAESIEEARLAAATNFAVSKEEIEIEQDPDVLDTWFSSGLFPFSVFGWPDQTPDLEKYVIFFI
jgi:valyl-tRNA synthetase